MRKTLTVTIDREGRDKGKVFLLTEFSAVQAERWATRALLMLAKGGVDIPDDLADMPIAALARIGLGALARISYADAEPLLDEMLTGILVIPDPSRPNVTRPATADGDIEEVATLIELRREVFQLITGFSLPAGLLKLAPAGSADRASSST